MFVVAGRRAGRSGADRSPAWSGSLALRDCGAAPVEAVVHNPGLLLFNN